MFLYNFVSFVRKKADELANDNDVQMDPVAGGLASCMWTLYLNVTVIPEENFVVWLLNFYV